MNEQFSQFIDGTKAGELYWEFGSNQYARLNPADGVVFYNTRNLERFSFDSAEDFAKWYFLKDKEVTFNYSFRVGFWDRSGDVNISKNIENGYKADLDNDSGDVFTIPKRITEKERNGNVPKGAAFYQYDLRHKMNSTMCKIFTSYLKNEENIPLKDILVGDHGDEGKEIAIFNIRATKAKYLQDIQNKMVAGFGSIKDPIAPSNITQEHRRTRLVVSAEDFSECVEDYDDQAAALAALAFIRNNGYHRSEYDDKKVYFNSYKFDQNEEVTISLDVEIWGKGGEHLGFGKIEHAPVVLINNVVQVSAASILNKGGQC